MRPRGEVDVGKWYFAIIDSWRFDPIGMQTMFVDQKLDLSVKFVGYSSSLIETSGRLFLSSSPSEVAVRWIVNDQVAGGLESGVVVSVSPTTGTYIAPSCPPRRNPVYLNATIGNATGFAPRYGVFGGLHVRVLARKWSLQWFVTAATDCNGQQTYSDRVDWAPKQPTISFTLDDNFHGSATQTFLAASHDLKACQVCPGGTMSISKPGTDTPMMVLVTADWNKCEDAMDLNVYTNYSGLQGAFARCTHPNGEWEEGVIPEFLGFEYPLLGFQPKDTFDATDDLPPWTIGVAVALDGICP